MTFIDVNTNYDKETGEAGLLIGDMTIRSLRSVLRLPLIEQTNGFVAGNDSFLMPGQIGIELDQDGMLSLDSTVFDEALAENYTGLLDLIGADKSGSSTNDTIQFYNASSSYTAGGTYDVEVTVSGGAITSARIKADYESTYRNATIAGNIITGDNAFSQSGEPLYPENGLQLSVDVSQDGVFTATVRVKQGFAGALDDALNRILKSSTGLLTLDQESVDTRIENLEDDIENEEERLSRREERLMLKYARLERMLTLMRNQTAALGG